MTVSAHTDRREALPGARFVTTTIAVGAAEGWRADLEIPARHGVAQTVGDSVGPGGVLRALRHVPELVAIARDVADLAPAAWLVNYSNPLTANVRAVTRTTDVRTFGLCHGTMHTRAALAADLGVPDKELHTVFAGLNHLCWLLDVRHGSRTSTPGCAGSSRSVPAARTRPPTRGRACTRPCRPTCSDVRALPGAGRPARLRVLRRVPPRRPAPWGLQGGHDMTLRYIDEKGDLWQRLRAQATGEEPLAVGGNQEAERLVTIAEAIVTGRDHVELAVNLPNRGVIPDLPAEAVVEVPASSAPRVSPGWRSARCRRPSRRC